MLAAWALTDRLCSRRPQSLAHIGEGPAVNYGMRNRSGIDKSGPAGRLGQITPLLLMLGLAPLHACEHGREDGSVPCGTLEPRNDDEIALCNDLDQAVIAHLALPSGTPPPQGWPAVVVLHGSGGLFETLDDDVAYGCGTEPHAEFARWKQLLVEQGYVVIMPDSFYSRGFCEWSDRDEIPEEPDMDEHDRLVLRVFDAWAAAEWACDQPFVDCDNLGVLGFSNGGSVALMSVQYDFSATEDERLREHGAEEWFRGVIAYYPGCGFQGELANDLGEEYMDAYYGPTAPVVVQHAERDHLLDDCEELRDPQVEAIADELGHDGDWFHLQIYENARHGFDGAEDESDDDYEARVTAEVDTLSRLAKWLK